MWEPRFSPDGRYLSFLAARPADSGTQLWLLDRRGGEARAVSHVSGEISGYEWSPDGAHVVLVMSAEADSSARAKSGDKTVKPLVIDAFQFKADERGYLTAGVRTHLYLLDVRSGECAALTAESTREDSAPAFSPDGRQIAFVGTAIGTARDVGRDDIYIMAASAGAPAVRLLSTFAPNHQKLEWSPDGHAARLPSGR